jgi:hypothetical protein
MPVSGSVLLLYASAELSPIPQAYTLQLNDTNVTVAFFSNKKRKEKKSTVGVRSE